jgi:hypothetical protein
LIKRVVLTLLACLLILGLAGMGALYFLPTPFTSWISKNVSPHPFTFEDASWGIGPSLRINQVMFDVQGNEITLQTLHLRPMLQPQWPFWALQVYLASEHFLGEGKVQAGPSDLASFDLDGQMESALFARIFPNDFLMTDEIWQGVEIHFLEPTLEIKLNGRMFIRSSWKRRVKISNL